MAIIDTKSGNMDNETIVEKQITDILHFLLVNVIIFGIIGNVLTYRVLSSKKLQQYPISIYLQAVSIFDSIMILNALIYFVNQKYSWDLTLLSDFFCKMRNYFLYGTGPVSPWLMVVVSLDRFINIAFPKRFLFIRRFSLQITLIIVIAIYNYTLYSFMIWNSDLISGRN